MANKDLIKLKYVEGKKVYEGTINRQEFLNHMNYLVEEFPDNNEIAKKLVRLIPEMNHILINKDMNDTQDVPFVYYKLDGSSEGHILKILRFHSIIWGFFERYCYDAKVN